MKTINNNLKGLSKLTFSLLIAFAILATAVQSTFAQTISSYSFTQLSGTYTQAGLGATLTTSGCFDDQNFSTLTLPFTFTYAGVAFSTVTAQQNGFAVLGSSAFGYSAICSGTAYVLSPLNGDLYGCTANGADFTYATMGSSPNRVFVMQWGKWGFWSSGQNEFSFQIRLYETSNRVQFIYNNGTGTASQTVYVGMTGASSADFQGRTTTSNWSATTAASSTCGSTCTINSTVRPTNGLTFTWASASTVAGMAFTQSIGTYVPIIGGSAMTSSTPSGCYDDAGWGPSAIPFTFLYRGVTMTHVAPNPNGYVQLQTSPATSTLYYNAMCSYADILSPMNSDLYGCTSVNGDYSYITYGTAPSRVFIRQWTNWGFWSGGQNEFSFQIRLYETSNHVEYWYGPSPGVSSGSVYVGLTGATTSDFQGRTTSSNWATTTASGSACASTCTINSSVRPVNGLIFRWAPPTCSTPTAFNVTGGGTVTCNAGVAVGLDGSQTSTNYQLQRNAVNTGSPVSGTGSAISFPVQNVGGTYTVVASSTTGTCTANMAGNAVVTVVADVTLPTIAGCPANITLSCSGVATFTAPTVTDNCGGSSNVSVSFNYTGSTQTWTVPAGVTSITVDAQGAQGGSGSAGYGSGGLGGRMQSTLAVTPGSTLTINVGGQPASSTGGFNGGGNGGSNDTYSKGGGGATDIRIGGTALSNRVLVAGGGGGGGTDCFSSLYNNGGTGGGLSGGNGFDCLSQTGYVGFGGTQLAGGVSNFGLGTAGTSGQGGNGQSTYGGGGGGGFFGGGGGGYGGGGGGSALAGSGTSSVTHTNGFRSGNGVLAITYSITYPVISQTAGLVSGATYPGGVTTNVFTATDGSGNTALCTFTVTVADNTAPTIAGCPANATLSCPDIYTYTAPTATDNCGGGTSGTVNFNHTGSVQTWVVPGGVTSITVDAQGAQGGSGTAGYGNGGLGGRMQTTLAVTPGSTLNIYIGGSPASSTGGFNGGGNAGNNDLYSKGGGGASDIRIGGTALSNRVLVAGGGGGGGTNCFSTLQNNGGTGGGLSGGDGYQCNTQTSYQGTGGTQSAGGISNYGFGTAGTSGQGGSGNSTYGGGGGGGYFGGGGGSYGGGGGGSGFAGTGTSGVTHTNGFKSGNGFLSITYSVSFPTLTQTTGLASGSAYPNGVTTNTFVATDASGNTSVCIFTVTVGDNTAPTIANCPASTSLSCPDVFTYTAPTATDNCGGSITGTVNFNFTGAAQTWTVPGGVTSITVDAKGAQGGLGYGGAGGLGGRAQGTISVTPGAVLQINVGGTGASYAFSTSGTGGFNGGGSGWAYYSGTGGGASDIRAGGTALSNRVFVAGGGGGGGYYCGSGDLGGPGGASSSSAGRGYACSTQGYSGYEGWGGNQTAGGLGGGFGSPNGTLGIGGGANYYYGGSGGGGYYGGGAAYYGGGGGGSNFVGSATGVTQTAGFKTGTGQVTISYAVTFPTLVQTAGLASGVVYPNGVTTNTFVATDLSSNTSVCTFTVTVNDATAPTISGCPSSVSLTCPDVVTYTTPTATDNCGGTTSGNVVFSFTGAAQTFTVPGGVTSITVDARGGKGGNGSTGTGGSGGRVQTTLTVTPGQSLQINVGGAGGNLNNTAGFNGGGNNPGTPYPSNVGGGGGASDIRQGGTALSNRIMVAGGGGGAGYNGCGESGGAGGGLTGASGALGCAALAATGGSQSAGGTGGNYGCCGYLAGANGTLGIGGNGGSNTGAGGGGGGYYGGGGGSWNGGGGGSSYSNGTGTTHTQGFNAGAGQVTISYSVSFPTLVQTSGLVSGSLFPNGTTTNTFTSTDASGNSSTCTFTVTASDYTNPVLSGCPSSVDIGCTGVATFATPTGTDNCPGTFSVPGGSQTFAYSGAIQNFIVPSGVTALTITARGAKGGPATSPYGVVGGNGAVIIGTVTVTPGATLRVLVGQQGGSGNGGSNGGGGGGSFVWTQSGNNLLVAAGGGGGGGYVGGTSGGGSATTTPTSGGGAGSGAGGSAGSGGSGGAGVNGSPGFPATGGGGAGWLTNGANGTIGDMGLGGATPLNGGAGGAVVTSIYGCSGCSSAGGFGGGGSSVGNGGSGGGGGGYNGGGGGNIWSGSNWGSGGGGGSFNSGSAQSNTANSNTGNGQVILTWATISIPSPIITQIAGLSSGSVFPVGVTTNTFKATDLAGNSSTCSFTVTAYPIVVVTATANPNIVCPGGTSQLGTAGTTVTSSPGTLFSENWSSSSFSTNSWTFSPSQSNWTMGCAYTPTGGACPNAYFNWNPSLSNYSISLISPVIVAPVNLPVTMDYLLHYNNFSSSTVEQFRVEYKRTTDGTWTLLENYSNQVYTGVSNFNRTNQALTGMAGFSFQVRFTAYGQNSFNINGWGLDNIIVKGAILTTVSEVIPSGTTFSWTPGTYLSATNIQNPVASGVNATTVYTITAQNGTCTGPASSVTLNMQSGDPIVSISSNQPTPNCPGNAVTLTANISNSVPNRTLLWSTSATTNTISVSPSVATTYTVTVTDGCFGATASASFTVTVATIGTVAMVPPLNCGTLAFTSAQLSAYSGGTLLWQFQTPFGIGAWTTIGGATTQNVGLTASIGAGSGTVTFGLRSQIVGCTNVVTPAALYTQDDPAAPTNTVGGERCSNGPNVCVTANVPANHSVEWWSAASGGTMLGTGSPFCYAPSASGNIFAASRNSVTGCLGSVRTATAIVVHPAPAINLTNSNPTICNPGSAPNSSSLVANVTNGIIGGGPNDYQVATIPFSPTSGSGTTVSLGDDQVSGVITMPFNFTFYGVSYNTLIISSNGFISMGSGNTNNGCCSGGLLPNAGTPNNTIALAWEDLYPPGGGTISYFTSGTRFVVRYANIPHYFSGNPVTGQIELNSADNSIEMHLTSMPSDGGLHTQGIENSTGTLGLATPGRNQANWSATNDGKRFFTQVTGTFTYAWTPTTGLSGTTSGTVTGSDATTVTASPIVDQVYTVTFTNNTTGCSNTATTTIISNKAPVLSNQGPLTQNTDPGVCSAVVTYPGLVVTAGTPAPTVTYSLSAPGVDLPYTNTGSGTGSGLPFNKGVTTVTVTATNSCGTVSRIFTINVQDFEVPVITQEADISVFNSTGDCFKSIVIVIPEQNDNCPFASISGIRDDAEGLTSDYPVGTTTITWTAVDASGNTSWYDQYVEVVDNEIPSITCPANITLNNTTGLCSRVVTYAASANDNCGVLGIVHTPPSGTSFPVGTTSVTAVATDIYGNTNSCSFTVTIIDAQVPNITACAPNIIFPPNVLACKGTLGGCSSVALGTPSATDNCTPGGSLVKTPRLTNALGNVVTSLTEFVMGANTVHWTVTDAAGNFSTCNQTVTITSTKPVILSVIPSSTIFFMGSTITVTASWQGDCNQLYSWVMDWDDGTNSAIQNSVTNVLSDGSGFASVTFNHTFPNSLVAEPKFSARELCGNKISDLVGGVSTIQYLIVSTTQTARTTAGGWYNFPSTGFPSSFVGSRMNVGNTVGTFSQGNSNNISHKGEFQSNRHQINDFRVHTSNNHSASTMEFYVVQGCSLAFYKTAARLNGNLGYKLTVWQTDKDRVPAVGNKIRVKVTQDSNGAIVFDTQPGASDAVLPSTSLAHGTIKIHNNANSGCTARELEAAGMSNDLLQNIPNPFSGQTEIGFTVPEDGKYTLKVYNYLGEEVAVLFNGEAFSGENYKVKFDGSSLQSGIYLYTLTNGDFRATRRMSILK